MKVQVVADASTRDVVRIFTGKGKRHDFDIFQERKAHFTSQTQGIADKGYQGIQKFHTNRIIPIRAMKARPLSTVEKLYNKLVSKYRIYIEKDFPLRFSLICGIYNF